MSDDGGAGDRNAEVARLLREIAERLGHGAPLPEDPIQASRWNLPLNWHAVHLAESLHGLRNALQVLLSLIEQFGSKLDRNVEVSRENAKVIAELKEISQDMVSTARRIEENIGLVVHDEQLLMRDLFRIDTNGAEIIVIAITVIESLIFSAGSETLINSALFTALSSVLARPMAWGLISGFLAISSICAFITRRRKFRICASYANAVYFGITGGLIGWMAPGAMGWGMQFIGFGCSFWILARGPSRAI